MFFEKFSSWKMLAKSLKICLLLYCCISWNFKFRQPGGELLLRNSGGKEDFFGSLNSPSVFMISTYLWRFKSVLTFFEKCLNSKRSSRSAQCWVKKRTFVTHIFAKVVSFSLISRMPKDSQSWSKIKKMRLNLTDPTILTADPGGPGTTREKSFLHNFVIKNDF